MSPARTLVALNGSPLRGSSVDRLLEAVGEGVREAGGEFVHFRCAEMHVVPCIACGPDATPGYCVFHDDMDAVYAALERAHAIVVGTPVYFDGVSAQLKLLIDRCNCVTPLVTLPDGRVDTVPKWRRTRRGAFVVAHSAKHPHEHAERTVRGFLKWIGAKWEETIAWSHADDDFASVARESALLDRAKALGARLIASEPLTPSTDR